jgi:hypothetical protein
MTPSRHQEYRKPTAGIPWVRIRPTERHPWAWVLILGAFFFAVSPARACNIPVFRYAVERWIPAPYEATIFHGWPVSLAEEKLIGALWLHGVRDATLRGDPAVVDRRRANMIVQACDISPLLPCAALRSGPVETALVYTFIERCRAPWMLVRYPASAKGTAGTMWSGPLTPASARSLLDSPLRRELGRRLTEGASAVWVLIESGDKAADDAAFKLLETQLKQLEKTLELPKLTKGPRDKLLFEDGPELRIAFSILRVARTDAQEAITVRMLLNMEDDLPQRREPIVFPIFGRGLALYALVGKGINTHNIASAAEFIVGACKCEAKNQNPGVDMLLFEDWVGGLKGELTRAKLYGLEDILPPPPLRVPAPPSSIGPNKVVVAFILAIVGGAVILTLIGFFFRGKSHVRG